MPSIFAADERAAWHSRYQGLADPLQRRSALVAKAVVVFLIAQLAVAQLTLATVACLAIAGRLSRWRPLWLAIPAAAGLVLVLATGAGPAIAGYAAVGDEVVRHLASPGPAVSRIAGLPAVLVTWRRWLPVQLPLALLVAPAQVAVAHVLERRRSATPAEYRPGVLVATRRAYLTGSLRRGEVATLDGGCVGVEYRTGRRAAISWREAQEGVLCTGQDQRAVTATGLELVIAGIQHRKAVIIIDLVAGAGDHRDGRADLSALVESACADVQAPLRRLDSTTGSYEPFLEVNPDRAAAMVSAMIDWTGMAQARQAFCADYLSAALAVIAAPAAGPGRTSASVLDDLIRLLQPGELRGRLQGLPGGAPGNDALARRAGDLAAQLDADPVALAPVAAQLGRLRSTALGARLRPPVLTGSFLQPGRTGPGSAQPGRTGPGPAQPGRTGQAWPAWGTPLPDSDPPVSLGEALAGREVAMLALDRGVNGRPAVMIARLAVADLAEVLAERGELGVRCDCLVWINGCEVVDSRQLAALVALGSRTGTSVLLGTTSGAAATRLATSVNVLVVRGPAPAGCAPAQDKDADGRVGNPGHAAQAGRPGSPEGSSLREKGNGGLAEDIPASQGADELTLRVRGPHPRLVAGCLVVR